MGWPNDFMANELYETIRDMYARKLILHIELSSD